VIYGKGVDQLAAFDHRFTVSQLPDAPASVSLDFHSSICSTGQAEMASRTALGVKKPAGNVSAPKRSGKPGSPSRGGGAGAAGGRGHESEVDEYVTNLKGQLYLLTIENEMLKNQRAQEDPALGGGGMAGSESQSDTYSQAATRAAHKERRAIEAAEAAAAAALPDEFADLEAHMRAKYAQVEHKYQVELADARRAAEALSTQCAAQSSLIAALKQEVSSANDVIGQQRSLLSQSEAALGAELKRAQDEISELKFQQRRLEEELEGARRTISNKNDNISELKSRIAEAEAAKAASDASRANTLSKYARVYTALRVVLKHWREERIQRLAALTGIDTVSN
jgi:predicted  nucleic acid-binding Zn-ribbon protein